MKYRFLIPFITVCFLLQGTFFSALPILGVTPDLVLAFLLILPLYYGGSQALVLSLVFGLLRDVCFGVSVGPTALLYFLLSGAVMLLRGQFYAEKFYTVPLIILPGTAAFQVLYWAFMRMLGRPYAFLTMAERLPGLLLLELVWAVAIYLLIGRNPMRFARSRDLFGKAGSRA